MYCPVLHSQIIDGATKSEKQKEFTESAPGLKSGLIGFVLRACAKSVIFIMLWFSRTYVHLSIRQIGFVLHNPDEPEPNRIPDLRTALTNPANLVFHHPFLLTASVSYEGGEKRRRQQTRRADITNFEKVGHWPKSL